MRVSLDKSEIQFDHIGETAQLTALVLPDDASNKNVNWKSSDENVCYVSNGTVVAVGYGIAIIIATSEDGGHMAVCKVTVEKIH